MAPPRKKTKKSKGAKGRKDEWTMEGGMSYAAATELKDANGKFIPRRSQEKDEKLRRGILKAKDHEKKASIIRKLKRKPALATHLEELSEESEKFEESEEDSLIPKRQRNSSGKSVLARLRMFTGSNDESNNDSSIGNTYMYYVSWYGDYVDVDVGRSTCGCIHDAFNQHYLYFKPHQINE